MITAVNMIAQGLDSIPQCQKTTLSLAGKRKMYKHFLDQILISVKGKVFCLMDLHCTATLKKDAYIIIYYIHGHLE